ncbi:MAG: BatD family protein [Gemmatimonadaceae bacterium]|nr:BatD family protein [Gemmatimonadaceae bacterium]
MRVLRQVLMAGFVGVSVLSAQPSPTAILGDVRVNPSRPIDFHAAAYPDSVYVGEQITYQVAVLLSENARSRLRRNPEFLPPELRGLLAYELGTPRRVPPTAYRGATFEAHVFQRALFPVAPGVLRIPAPQLTYSLPQSASYFSREESFVVRAESATVVVRALPEEDRPPDFSGAVGVLSATTLMDASAARVGDPLVLTVRVEGVGNVKLLPRPVLELSWASVVPGTERVQIDTSGARVRGVKEFDFLVTPTQPGAVVVPVVRYSYFDPYAGAYAWAESRAADITVAAGDPVVAGALEESPMLSLRDWQDEAQDVPVQRLDAWPIYWRVLAMVLWVAAPLLAIAGVWRARRRQRAEAAPVVHVREPVIESDPDSPESTARRVRRAFLKQLATRLHVDGVQIGLRSDLERVLRRHGVSRATTHEALEWLDASAEAGYGAPSSTAVSKATWSQDAATLYARVDQEAVAGGEGSRWMRWKHRRAAARGTVARSRGSRAAIALGAALWTTQPVPVIDAPAPSAPSVAAADVSLLVQEARAAYEGRRYPRATQQWARAVAARPNDVTLLVNWGTAAWAAGDTVSAVVAWQRASRLDPLAADVHERLLLLPPTARSGFADVPMLPLVALVVACTICWLAGWGQLYRALSARVMDASASRSLPSRSLGAGLLLLALAGVSFTWFEARHLSTAELAVVRRPDMLRSAPLSSARPAGGVTTGDMVRMRGQRGEWVEVQHADGRSGWLPNTRIITLNAPLQVDDLSR